MRSLTIAALFVLLGSFAVPNLALAQLTTPNNIPAGSIVTPNNTSSPTSNATLVNPLKSGTTLPAFLTSILDFVINIGTIVVILMLVFVGFKFVAAQGAPGEIEKAKSMLLWTVIGALILLGSKAISLGILATVKSLGS